LQHIDRRHLAVAVCSDVCIYEKLVRIKQWPWRSMLFCGRTVSRLLVTFVILAKTAELIEMLFGWWCWWAKGTMC